MIKNRSIFVYGVVFVAMAFVSASPADAQREIEPLFDKFNFKLEGSWVALKTDIRLDSEVLGRGTTLSFEDDLNLDSDKVIPTLSFQWQIARKHKLAFRWQDINRESVKPCCAVMPVRLARSCVSSSKPLSRR